MDTEEFLASLAFTSDHAILCCDADGASTTNVVAAANGHIPYRVVTQKYGKGIVEYGTQTQTITPGGSYLDICDATGTIYIELDTSCPACISCDSVDGYVGSLIDPTSVIYSTLEMVS